MGTLIAAPSNTWKALIRKICWPTVAKTFRTQSGKDEWHRRTKDEMVEGVYTRHNASERMTLESALKRHLSEITPSVEMSPQ